ncbi:MAG: archease [Acidobacteria bacterium]|nr:archease [Acidobacteriota bacterium]
MEHTADLGLRVFGRSKAELLEHAAQGMFSLMGRADFPASELRELNIEIPPGAFMSHDTPRTAVSDDERLVAWLKRLLREFNLRAFFPVRFQVQVTPDGCTARVLGGRFDPAVHTFYTEIKGVTLHALKVAKMDSGWQAEVVFDV